MSKTATLHVHHAFLYFSLPSLHDYNVKVPNFTFCWGREHKTTTFLFFSWTLIQSFRIQLQKKLPTFDELKWRFHSRRRRCCLSSLLGTLSNDDDDDGSVNVTKEMNLRSFKLNRVYLEPLNMSNAGNFSWSWIRKDFIQVQKEEGKFVVLCPRPHVAVVQWTPNKCTKKHDAREELLFWSLNLLFFDVVVVVA